MHHVLLAAHPSVTRTTSPTVQHHPSLSRSRRQVHLAGWEICMVAVAAQSDSQSSNWFESLQSFHPTTQLLCDPTIRRQYYALHTVCLSICLFVQFRLVTCEWKSAGSSHMEHIFHTATVITTAFWDQRLKVKVTLHYKSQAQNEQQEMNGMSYHLQTRWQCCQYHIQRSYDLYIWKAKVNVTMSVYPHPSLSCRGGAIQCWGPVETEPNALHPETLRCPTYHSIIITIMTIIITIISITITWKLLLPKTYKVLLYMPRTGVATGKNDLNRNCKTVRTYILQFYYNSTQYN